MDGPGISKTCDHCKERPARNHLCQIVNGQETILDLCDECLRVHSESEGFELPSMDGSQRCCYCREPAQSGSMNQGPEYEVRQETFHYTCNRCAALESKLMLEALESISGDLGEEEQHKAIVETVRNVDNEIRKRFDT